MAQKLIPRALFTVMSLNEGFYWYMQGYTAAPPEPAPNVFCSQLPLFNWAYHNPKNRYSN